MHPVPLQPAACDRLAHSRQADTRSWGSNSNRPSVATSAQNPEGVRDPSGRYAKWASIRCPSQNMSGWSSQRRNNARVIGRLRATTINMSISDDSRSSPRAQEPITAMPMRSSLKKRLARSTTWSVTGKVAGAVCDIAFTFPLLWGPARPRFPRARPDPRWWKARRTLRRRRFCVSCRAGSCRSAFSAGAAPAPCA